MSTDDQTVEVPADFAAMLQPGRKLHRNKQPIEIRGEVDGYIIFRSWSYRHRAWRYGIEGWYMFFLWWQAGELRPRR